MRTGVPGAALRDVNRSAVLRLIGRFGPISRADIARRAGVSPGTVTTLVRNLLDAGVVTPIEQHVHSFLEILPLMGLVLVVVLHWGQFLALFGLGTEAARFDISLRQPPLPWGYVLSVLAGVLLFELLPYIEEMIRGLRANNGALVPRQPRVPTEDAPAATASAYRSSKD